MKLKHFVFIVFILLFVWVFFITLAAGNFGSHIRWFNDYYDRSVYVQRSAWFIEGGIPYVDTFSEYPQVATYFFALPYLLMMQLQPVDTISPSTYSMAFSFLTLFLLGGVIFLLYKSIQIDSRWAFLLLLPAPLYFSFNRFDILPAFFVLVSILLFFQDRKLLSVVFLGVGAMTKWYPVLLFPVFWVFDCHKKKRIRWGMPITFILTVVAIVLPTYLFGGWEAVFAPYRMHLARGLEYVSLPALLNNWLFSPLGIHLNARLLGSVFLVLQLFPTLFSLIIRLDDREDFLNWSVVIVGLFVGFSEIYSPQWILWLLPLFLLVAKTKKDIFLVILYSISTYIAFPVLFDGAGVDSVWLVLVSLFNFVLLGVIIFSSLKKPSHMTFLLHR